MSIFSDVFGAAKKIVTGGFAGGIIDAIAKVLPPDIDPVVKAQIDLAATQEAHRQEIALMSAWNDAELAFNERTLALEGTASDLKAIPILGPIMIFLRGSFRPLFSFAVMFWDWKIFSGAWASPDPELLIALNVLVLGFYFGERAVKNILPALTHMKSVGR